MRLKDRIFRLITNVEKEAPLPSGYTAVGYVIAHSLPYIDTNINSSDDTEVEVECAASNVSVKTGVSRMILAAGSSTSNGIMIQNDPAVGAIQVRWGTNAFQTSSLTIDPYKICKVTLSASAFKVEQNGVLATDITTAGTISPAKFRLFKSITGSTALVDSIIGRFKIRKNGVLVADFRPCYNNSTREVGFYEMVGGAWYGNTNTVGRFEAKYLDFPTGYTQLTHIRSSGTEWFSTGLYLSNRTTIDMTVTPYDTSETVQAWLGAYDGSRNSYLGKGNRNTYRVYYAYGTGSNQQYYDYETATEFAKLKVLHAKGASKFVCDTNSANLSGVSYTNNQPAYLFARKNVTEVAIPASVDMYGCQIMTDTTVSRLYVPALRNQDNVAGMYDLKQGNFKPSETSTDFIAGSVMP